MPCVNASGPSKRTRKPSRNRRWQAAAKAGRRASGIMFPNLPGTTIPTCNGRKSRPSDLRRTKDGRLIIPVLNQSGRIQSLQFILPEQALPRVRTSSFSREAHTAGGFFLHFLPKTGTKDGPLLIAEGYATAISLHLATGYARTGGLQRRESGSRGPSWPRAERMQSSEIILCADNDM